MTALPLPTKIEKRRKVIGSILELLFFNAIIIFAGHGAGPIGLLLTLGFWAWMIPSAIGWLGVGIKLISLFQLNSENYGLISTIGSIALLASVVSFAFQTELLVLTLVTAVPFCVTVGMRLVPLILATFAANK